MLGKLMKYEFKATSRTFLPIYIALILVAAMNRIFRVSRIDMGFGISTLVLVGLFMALGVLTLIMIIQRFSKNLLGDEGYLMFTLPVNSVQLIGSKLIISLLWSIISSIVAFLTFIILIGDAAIFNELFTNWRYIWEEFSMMVQRDMSLSSPILLIIIMLVFMLLGYMSFVFEIYLALATAQLPIFNKHRSVIGFISFFVINVALSMVGNIMSIIIPDSSITSFIAAAWFFIISSLVVCLVLFLATKYILDKHLNLE